MAKNAPPTLRQKIKLYTVAANIIAKTTAVNFAIDNASCICDALYSAQIELKFIRSQESYITDVRWSRRNGQSIVDSYENGFYYDCIQHNFPELLKYKPNHISIGYFWWDYKTIEGSQKRLEVIGNILKDLKAELNNS